jgi:hypothetical protein
MVGILSVTMILRRTRNDISMQGRYSLLPRLANLGSIIARVMNSRLNHTIKPIKIPYQ